MFWRFGCDSPGLRALCEGISRHRLSSSARGYGARHDRIRDVVKPMVKAGLAACAVWPADNLQHTPGISAPRLQGQTGGSGQERHGSTGRRGVMDSTGFAAMQGSGGARAVRGRSVWTHRGVGVTAHSTLLWTPSVYDGPDRDLAETVTTFFDADRASTRIGDHRMHTDPRFTSEFGFDRR
jgi:hypothetical protein